MVFAAMQLRHHSSHHWQAVDVNVLLKKGHIPAAPTHSGRLRLWEKSNSPWRQIILAERAFIWSNLTIFIGCRNSENRSTEERPDFLCLPSEETEEKAEGSSCPYILGQTCGGLQKVAWGSSSFPWAPPTRASFMQATCAWDLHGLRGSSWVRGEVCTTANGEQLAKK